MYMLVDSVTIPERSFIRASFDTGKATLENICKEAVDGIILKKWTAQEAADYIGRWAVEMTHDYFNTKLSPPKSATTQLTSTQYQPCLILGAVQQHFVQRGGYLIYEKMERAADPAKPAAQYVRGACRGRRL